MVDSAAAEAVKLSVIGLLNDRPGGPGLGCKCAEAFGGRGILGVGSRTQGIACDIEHIYGASAAQRLVDRIAACNNL